MVNVRCSHPTSPEMTAWVVVPMRKSSASKYCSDETFHQKLNWPGPMAVVESIDCWPLPIAPLRAADLPSPVVSAWPNHGALPEEFQVRLVASRASDSGTCTSSLAAALAARP